MVAQCTHSAVLKFVEVEVVVLVVVVGEPWQMRSPTDAAGSRSGFN